MEIRIIRVRVIRVIRVKRVNRVIGLLGLSSAILRKAWCAHDNTVNAANLPMAVLWRISTSRLSVLDNY